jgi:hypothetical protein
MTGVKTEIQCIIRLALNSWHVSSDIKSKNRKLSEDILEELFNLSNVAQIIADSKEHIDEKGIYKIWVEQEYALYPKSILIYNEEIFLPGNIQEVINKNLEEHDLPLDFSYLKDLAATEIINQLNQLWFTCKTFNSSGYVLDAFDKPYKFKLVKRYIKE